MTARTDSVMTPREREHVQRMFDAWRQLTGDYKMVKIYFDRPIWNDMHAFVDWASKQRGAGIGTLRAEVLAELRTIAEQHAARMAAEANS